MANDTEDEEEGGEVVPLEGEEGAAPKKGKRLIIIIIAAVVVLLLGGGAGLYFTGFFKPKTEEGEEGAKEEAGGEQGGEHGEKPKDGKPGDPAKPASVYYDLDEFLVNLNTNSKQPSFLKMSVALELTNPETAPEITAKMPRIRDTFQVYLRELRTEDLQGAAGIYRLREELLLRVNKVMYPTKVKDILFKEILVQ